MAYWLLKTEPTVYSFADLQKDKKTTWDGVTNNLALQYIRTIKKGDEALIYHTGTERSAIGVAEVIKSAYPDPKQDDPKLTVFDLRPGKQLRRPVSLDHLKCDPHFKKSVFLHHGRLSVVPLTLEEWNAILVHADA